MRHRPRLLVPWITLCAAVVVAACGPEPSMIEGRPVVATEPMDLSPDPAPALSPPEPEPVTGHALDDQPAERGHPQFVKGQLRPREHAAC